MQIDENKRARAALKTYFAKNAIPTEGQFAQLIDSALNQRDDGVVKAPGDPLSLEAAGDDVGYKKALNFYTSFGDPDPAWSIALRPRGKPADAATARPGWSVNDAAGNSRLCIDAATGNVGVGTVTPGEKLEVNGRVRAGALGIGPWPANPTGYAFIGSSLLDQANPGNYALLQGTGGEPGVTYLNSPSRVGVRIANVDKLVVLADGAAVNGSLKIGGSDLYFTQTDHDHTGFGNTAGFAAIENARNHDALMILGRATGQGRRVKLWDHLEVNGPLVVNGPITASGELSANGGLSVRVGGGERFTVVNDGARVNGSLKIAGSDLYFTETDHNHTGVGNTTGFAAIENARDYNALMILGRATPQGRRVRLWDHLEVNGDLVVTGRIGSKGYPADPKTPGWGGGLRTWDIEVEATLWARNAVQTGPRDLAEIFFSEDALEAGDVVSLIGESDSIGFAQQSHDPRVIGIVSSQPGFLLGSLHNREDIPDDGRAGHPIALTGCVPCKVSDEGGPIRRGDLVTPASRPGHAMRAAQDEQRPGTILGKALQAHAEGEGVIEVFVMLR